MRDYKLLLALLACLGFRVALVRTFACGTADGAQYLRLAHSLRAHGTFSTEASGLPLTDIRPPGFPIWLAIITTGVPNDPQRLADRVTLCNAILDSVTALFIALLARRLLGEGSRFAWIGVLAFAIFPSSFVFSAFILTESTATFMTVLTLFSMVSTPSMKKTFVTGLLVGASTLVRADLIVLVPSLALSCLRPGLIRRRHLAWALVGWILLPGAWMARNELHFSHLAPFGVEWTDAVDRPLPTCIVSWFRTWSNGARGDARIAGALFWMKTKKEAQPTPKMFDSTSEGLRVEALLSDLDTQEGLVRTDPAFCRLAHERSVRAPWRTFVHLPLRRARRLLEVPDFEGFHVGWLGLPAHQAVFDVLVPSFWVFAIFGAFIALFSAARWPVAILLSSVLARVALHAFAVPQLAGPRFFAEAVPIAALFIVFAVAWIARRVSRSP